MLNIALLAAGHLHLAPAPIDKMTRRQRLHLALVRAEPNESETLRLSRLCVLLDLRHDHVAGGLKVLAQRLLGRFPRQPQHDQIGAAQPRLDALGLGGGVLQRVVALALVLCVGEKGCRSRRRGGRGWLCVTRGVVR